MKITRGSIQGSRKSNANHDSDKRLNYGNERYKGYRISLDTKNGGYIVYDANGEIEDSGFKSMKSAKNFVDSLASTTTDDITSSDEFDLIDRSGSDEDIEIAAIAYNLGVSIPDARKLHPTLSESKIKEYVDYYHLRHLPLGKRVKQVNGKKDKVNASAYPKHHSKIYKGYKIIVDPAGDGYNVYNKSEDLEDEGIATMREAEELVDSLVVNSDESASNNPRVNEREEYCPHCTNLSLVGAGDGRAVCGSCGAEYQVSYKNGKAVKSEIISAAIDDSAKKTGIDWIKTKINDAAFSKMEDMGFLADEISDYLFVDVKQSNDSICVEVRAELDYDDLSELISEIDPIVQEYDPDAYFEPVTPGIAEAYIHNFDKGINIDSSTSVDDTVCRYKVEYYLGDNDEDRCVDYFYADSPEEAEAQLIETVGDDVRIVGNIPENVPRWYRDADNTQGVSASTDSENHEITYEQMIDDLGYFYDMYPEAIEPILIRNGATPSVTPDDSWVDGCDVPNAYAEAVEYFETHYDNDDPHSELNTGVGERLGWSNYIQASYINAGVKTLNFNGYDVEQVDGTFYVYLEDDAESEVMYEASSTESLDNFCVGLGEAWRKQYPESVTAANYGGAYDVDPHQYFTRDDIVDFGEYVCDHLNEIFYDTFTINDVYIVDYSRLVLEVMRASDESIFSCNVNIDMRKVRRPSDLKDKFWGTAVSALRSEIESLDQDISSCDTIEAAYDDLPPEPDMGDEVELEAELEFDLDTLIIVDDDGNFEYEDTTCPWIASEADSNGNFYEPEYDVYITDVNSVIEVVSDMLVTVVPINPGRYHVTGKVKLVYNISGVYEKRTYFKEYAGPSEYTDDYDREIYFDQAEVDFLMDKSYIKNFEYEPW